MGRNWNMSQCHHVTGKKNKPQMLFVTCAILHLSTFQLCQMSSSPFYPSLLPFPNESYAQAIHMLRHSFLLKFYNLYASLISSTALNSDD